MFVELKCKTNFSFLRGASHPEELVQRAIELGYSHLGICDNDGVYGVPKAYWRAKNIANFKIIVGSEITMAGHPPLTFLAPNRRAYGHLCRLITKTHGEASVRGQPQLTLQSLKEFDREYSLSELFVLTPTHGLQQAPPTQNKKSNRLQTDKPTLVKKETDFQFLKKLFPRLYIQVSRHLDGFDFQNSQWAIKKSREYALPLVATNDVHYHTPQRQALQDIVTGIREGVVLNNAGFKVFSNGERHLKAPQEMEKLFKDLPSALENSVDIANNCTFCPSELRYRYPSEWIPQGHTAQSYLEQQTWAGAMKRYKSVIPSKVEKQLRHELQLIEQLHYADYFLTIYDIVDFAQKKNILCQGRGSAANSVVCYCLGITAIDPVQMNLLFERFISVERNEPPDIDVDFEHERREEVIQYVYEKYGRHRAAMLSAVITYKRRSALREVSKVFGLPVGTLSAKKVEKDFKELLSQSPMLNETKNLAEQIRQRKNLAEQVRQRAEDLTNFPRHLSIHSGGFTLSADPIVEIVPVIPAAMEGRTIIQWDKYDLDYLGLLKVDLLSLGMLSAIKKSLDQVGLKLYEIPQDDEDTYRMIQAGQTVGVFQIESRAQISMCGRMQARNFYDLVIQIAMIRPGPIVGGMVHPFLRRRRGEEPVTFPHPKLRNILGKTMGVPLFQEQVMKIAIELGGFSPGEADELRRAIGAWRTSDSVEKMGQRLMEGLIRNGLPQKFANQVFNQVKGFSEYGFPESHSASFALLAYASCYLKYHYPASFLAAVVNSQPMGFYSNHTLLEEAKRFGVSVLPIDINKSQWDCLVTDTAINGNSFGKNSAINGSSFGKNSATNGSSFEKNSATNENSFAHTSTTNSIIHRSKDPDRQQSILLGWRILKGLSEKEVQQIVAHRPYFSLEDFLTKNKIRQHILHRMAMGGVFDIFNKNRRQILWRLLNFHRQQSDEQLSLLTHLAYESSDSQFENLNAIESIREDHRATSLSTTAHPMAPLRELVRLPEMTSPDIKHLHHNSWVKTAGLMLVFQRPATAKGVVFITLEDEWGFADLILHKRTWEKYKDILDWHCFVKIEGRVQRDLRATSVLVKKVEAIELAEKEQYKNNQSRFFNR